MYITDFPRHAKIYTYYLCKIFVEDFHFCATELSLFESLTFENPHHIRMGRMKINMVLQMFQVNNHLT